MASSGLFCGRRSSFCAAVFVKGSHSSSEFLKHRGRMGSVLSSLGHITQLFSSRTELPRTGYGMGSSLSSFCALLLLLTPAFTVPAVPQSWTPRAVPQSCPSPSLVPCPFPRLRQVMSQSHGLMEWFGRMEILTSFHPCPGNGGG